MMSGVVFSRSALGFILVWMASSGTDRALPRVDPPAPPENVRYSGADGVELKYPTAWSRGRVVGQQEAPALFLVRLNDAGEAVGRFQYVPMDLSSAPEADRNARFLAQETVAAARQDNPQSVLKDATPTTVGGMPSSYFELLRPGPDGKPMTTLNWAVSWNAAHFLFTFATASDDAALRAEAEAIVKGVAFTEAYRKDDGSSVVFRDRAGRVTINQPSHWHDEPPPRPVLVQWGIYDEQGTRQAVIQLTSDRIKGEATTPQEFLAAMARQMATVLVDVQPHPAEAYEVAGLKGHRQKLQGMSKEGEGRTVYMCVLERDGWFVVLSATVANAVDEQFHPRWESVLGSIRLD